MLINLGFVYLFFIHFTLAIDELSGGFSKYSLLQLLVSLSFAIIVWGLWFSKEWSSSLAMGWAIAKCIIINIASTYGTGATVVTLEDISNFLQPANRADIEKKIIYWGNQQMAGHLVTQYLSEPTPDRMRLLFDAIDSNVPVSASVVDKVTAILTQKTYGWEKLQAAVQGTRRGLPIAIQKVFDIRNSLGKRISTIEATIAQGKMTPIQVKVFTAPSHARWRPSDSKPEEIAPFSPDGYNLYMLSAIKGQGGWILLDIKKGDPLLSAANFRGETLLHLLVEQGNVLDVNNFQNGACKFHVNS